MPQQFSVVNMRAVAISSLASWLAPQNLSFHQRHLSLRILVLRTSKRLIIPPACARLRLRLRLQLSLSLNILNSTTTTTS